jgi:hypothetical protein
MGATIHVVRRIFGLTVADTHSRGLVRAFLREEVARDWIREQEAIERTRRDVNPFYFGENLAQCTSMPAEVLHDWLLDHEYPRHDLYGLQSWGCWWAANAEGFSLQQREQLWCILEYVRFFQVRHLDWYPRGKAPHNAYVRVRRRRQNCRGQFVDMLRHAVGVPGNGPYSSSIRVPLDRS